MGGETGHQMYRQLRRQIQQPVGGGFRRNSTGLNMSAIGGRCAASVGFDNILTKRGEKDTIRKLITTRRSSKKALYVFLQLRIISNTKTLHSFTTKNYLAGVESKIGTSGDDIQQKLFLACTAAFPHRDQHLHQHLQK